MAPEVCGGAPAGAVDRYGLRALVRQAAGRLAAAGVTSPQVDARILAEHLLGRPLPLADGADGDFSAAYDALVLRRECREPLQHVIGRMWLRGAELISRPGVFIVRPETEVVAGAAIEAAREAMAGGGGVVLTADLCTGSGAIAACVAEGVRGARVVAVEISETAAALARENCERLVPGRVEVIHADATDPLVLHDLNGQVDVVVSNPPYVPAGAVEDAETSRHEPAVALYGGGPDGLDIPVDVLVRSVALLRTGGVLVMEHDHEQGALLRAAALEAGFEQAETGQDLTGRDRYLRAVR